ncbi:MAG: hypothetical protein RLZZ360_753 [Candidatus Parcubacteria bacterium]|jgi:hypothetical protein
MEENQNENKKFTLKQQFLLFVFRSQQLVRAWLLRKKNLATEIVDTIYFQALIFTIFLCGTHYVLELYKLHFTRDQLVSIGLAVAGVIGASIAIVFSFSTFILQSTADLFSTQYLNKFIQDKNEKLIFWSLVALTFAAALVPIFAFSETFEILLGILFLAFLLIYSLYKQLRQRINPETTLNKIKNDAFYHLRYARRELEKQAKIQNKIYEQEEREEKFTLAIQYKAYPLWSALTLENVKYLYEIGLRLLSKNEINSFNLTLRYIHDVYLEHLRLRNEHVMCVPAGLWGTYTFEDENFTSSILEYLESISHRLIQEKRKENIYNLLNVYESILSTSLKFKYADQNMYNQGENPILSLVLGYYIGFIDKLTESNERDWIWESLKSLTKVSNGVLGKGYNHFNHNQINDAIDRIVVHCFKNKQPESLTKQAVSVYFSQAKVGWNQYPDEEIFWQDLFKGLQKSTLALVISSEMNLTSSELYLGFNEWLTLICNTVVGLEEGEEKKKAFDNFISLLERWSDYLLDFARSTGLENKQMGLQIIQAVNCNLRIINFLSVKFDKDLSSLYRTQMHTLSWYFHNVESVDSSHLFNLEIVQETLISEVSSNLDEQVFDPKFATELYIQLVKNYFDKVSLGHGYNHPRVIKKLVYLGLLFQKYCKDTVELVELIDNLNKRYIILNQDYWKMKKEHPTLSGPTMHQLCLELHELENDLFSYNRNVNHGAKMILKHEITQEIWDEFVAKIEWCKDIKYETRSSFF